MGSAHLKKIQPDTDIPARYFVISKEFRELPGGLLLFHVTSSSRSRKLFLRGSTSCSSCEIKFQSFIVDVRAFIEYRADLKRGERSESYVIAQLWFRDLNIFSASTTSRRSAEVSSRSRITAKPVNAVAERERSVRYYKIRSSGVLSRPPSS